MRTAANMIVLRVQPWDEAPAGLACRLGRRWRINGRSERLSALLSFPGRICFSGAVLQRSSSFRASCKICWLTSACHMLLAQPSSTMWLYWHMSGTQVLTIRGQQLLGGAEVTVPAAVTTTVVVGGVAGQCRRCLWAETRLSSLRHKWSGKNGSAAPQVILWWISVWDSDVTKLLN